MKTRELMRRAGVRPDGTTDQHFLVDERVLDRIVGYAPGNGDTHVLEVGGGVGNLTSRLVEKYETVTVVELDRQLAGFLANQFGTEGVDVVQGDATKAPLPKFDISVSNLPYSASSPLLFRLLPRGVPLVVTVQKEFANRAVASPGEDDYGRLSVTSGRYANAEILETVPPSAFEPEPEVESAVVRFEPHEEVRGDVFFDDVVRAVFTQRRKTLRNALRNTTHMTGIEEEQVYEVPEDLLSKRPGKMTPKEFERVADALRE
jgi:16S rRNA (adenine1518-N6/adenine1519-N6)-dimethyltransferase